MPEERPENLWENLLRTGKEIILRPQSFFQNMPLFGGYTQPLLFSSAIFIIILLYNILLLLGTGLPFPNGKEVQDVSIRETLYRASVLFILWVSGLFIGATILHGSFKLLKGRAPYQATFKIFSYSSVANLLNLVPLVGQYISTVYAFVLIMMGGKWVHGLSSPRAIAAPLLPALVLWLVLLALVFTGIIPLEKIKSSLNY